MSKSKVSRHYGFSIRCLCVLWSWGYNKMKNRPDWLNIMEKIATEELAKVLQEMEQETEGETNEHIARNNK